MHLILQLQSYKLIITIGIKKEYLYRVSLYIGYFISGKMGCTI